MGQCLPHTAVVRRPLIVYYTVEKVSLRSHIASHTNSKA
jgi:hypothetical protein